MAPTPEGGNRRNTRALARTLRSMALRGMLACLLYLAVASFVPRRYPCERADTQRDTVYVVNHGYHTGLIIPVDIMPEHWRPFLNIRDERIGHCEFGWGDRDFYMARGEDFGLALKALFTPTRSVMHVVPFYGEPLEIFKYADIRTLPIDNTLRPALLAYVYRHFQRDSSDKPYDLAPGLYGQLSRFYAAHGLYHCFYTCNNWIADALDTAGLPSPLWGGTAQSVMWHLPK